MAPEVSHNWEERVLTSQSKVNKASHVCSSLRTIVSRMWIDNLVIEKLDLDLYLVVCVHPLKKYCRRLLFTLPSFRENRNVNGGGGLYIF